jgi:glucose/mannose-6-phosphate isomerase
VLDQFALIDFSVSEEITSVSEFLTREQAGIKADSLALAKKLKTKTVIAYVEDRIKSVALRLKQQINENSKSNCWINVIPELNHNELVGWRFKNDTLAGLFLRSDFENPRNVLRFDFIKSTVADNVSEVHEVRAKGGTLLEQYFYHVHFGDWLSYYMALEHGVDPVEVHVIDKLKAHLSAVA